MTPEEAERHTKEARALRIVTDYVSEEITWAEMVGRLEDVGCPKAEVERIMAKANEDANARLNKMFFPRG